MSEEILKALIQLYAIITKQGTGISERDREYILRSFQQRLSEESVQGYMDLFDSHIDDKSQSKTSVLDSVKTLSICKKINATLGQKQKVIVLLELFELIRHNKAYPKERKEIIDTVATVFNISEYEYKLIEKFALENAIEELDFPEILIANSAEPETNSKHKHFKTDFLLEDPLIFVYIPSVELFFVKFESPRNLELRMNNRLLKRKWLYLFSHGSIIKHPKGNNIYFNQIASQLATVQSITPIHFIAKNVEYEFSNGHKGLIDININEEQGKLISIIGGSGTGKTTLLNVLSTIEKPSSGTVTLNGIDIHKNSKNINGAIGYVPQFDILISEFTVYENLLMTAKLCLGKWDDDAIHAKIKRLLIKLGLWHIKDLRVGSSSDKKISGGQRKRLNIALELIREPSVIFLDEPTSGLSSKDSESIIQLLKEMTNDGKLIFSVVHQPSSDIFKMFDSIMILDQGGYCIFYGNPLESLVYFKRHTNQINSNQGFCHVCGSVNPEQLFEIIEMKVVDEYGTETEERKYSPEYWHKIFLTSQKDKTTPLETNEVEIPEALTLPPKSKQFVLFSLRDITQKFRDHQYLLLNLFVAPVLALILSYVLRYTNPSDEIYTFRNNENIPAYLFLGIIISMFMGLTGSAEEILKDRVIRKRERLLFLSRKSYLFSKILVQFSFSAIQTLAFVLIGNAILDFQNFVWPLWLMLFSTSCLANMLGLNISSAFKKAVTIYIAIPLLLIPQMILSGALFDFDKMNNTIRADKKTPIVADFIASRWAYEGLIVKAFKDNAYEKLFFHNNWQMSNAGYVSNYLIPEIKKLLPDLNNPKSKRLTQQNLELLHHHYPMIKYDRQKPNNTLTIVKYLNDVRDYAIKKYNASEKEYNKTIYTTGKDKLSDLKNHHHNERLEDLVRNLSTINRIIKGEDGFIRNVDPIYYLPKPITSLDFRAHFYAPKKHFLGKYYDTYYFNLCIIWLMTLLLYITLYYNVLKKIVF